MTKGEVLHNKNDIIRKIYPKDVIKIKSHLSQKIRRKTATGC